MSNYHSKVSVLSKFFLLLTKKDTPGQFLESKWPWPLNLEWWWWIVYGIPKAGLICSSAFHHNLSWNFKSSEAWRFFYTLWILLGIPMACILVEILVSKTKRNKPIMTKISINSVILLNKLVCSLYSSDRACIKYIDNACSMLGFANTYCKDSNTMVYSYITKLAPQESCRSRNHDKAE